VRLFIRSSIQVGINISSLFYTMCGFLGQFNTTKSDLDTDHLCSLLALSKNRGPDQTSVWANEKASIWLGFNRLSILELSEAGSQPMHSVSGRYIIVFNGEIYNHFELREGFGNRVWKGRSDTETILACIEQYGFKDTLHLLDGMFALAVFDMVENTLMCARDFAGIKPFFYGWDGRTFVFASQYNQITNHKSFRNNIIDPSVLKLYLQQHFMPAPFGLISQTGQLKPGEYIRISQSGLKRDHYWEMPEYNETSISSEGEALKLIDQTLGIAVTEQLMSDVPLGAFLSGGIDSPIVCHYAARSSTNQLQTFTIGSDSPKHDESDYADKYARLIGTNETLKKLDASEMMGTFDAAMNCLHEPMADFSILPTFIVSKLARSKVTVALSGDGGDELFYGYERFWSLAKNIKFQNYPWAFKAILYKYDKLATGNKKYNSVLLSSSQSDAHQGLHSRFPALYLDQLFPDLKNVKVPEEYDVYAYNNEINQNRLLQTMRKAEFYGMMQKTLRKVDLASMGVSLEVRVPFLSKKMIENSLMLDLNLSYGPGEKKKILKTLLRNLYPSAPVDDVKRGFTVPLGSWLRNPAFSSKIKDQYISSDLLQKYGIDYSAFDTMWHKHQSGTDLKWPLFTILALNFR